MTFLWDQNLHVFLVIFTVSKSSITCVGWNFLLAILCGLSDLSDTVCLQVKMRLQDAQWHQVSYISIPTMQCNQLLHFF